MSTWSDQTALEFGCSRRWATYERFAGEVQMNQFRAIDGVSALAESFDVFLIDQFGVLHDGLQPYRGQLNASPSLKSMARTLYCCPTLANGQQLISPGWAIWAFQATYSTMWSRRVKLLGKA